MGMASGPSGSPGAGGCLGVLAGTGLDLCALANPRSSAARSISPMPITRAAHSAPTVTPSVRNAEAVRNPSPPTPISQPDRPSNTGHSTACAPSRARLLTRRITSCRTRFNGVTWLRPEVPRPRQARWPSKGAQPLRHQGHALRIWPFFRHSTLLRRTHPQWPRQRGFRGDRPSRHGFCKPGNVFAQGVQLLAQGLKSPPVEARGVVLPSCDIENSKFQRHLEGTAHRPCLLGRLKDPRRGMAKSRPPLPSSRWPFRRIPHRTRPLRPWSFEPDGPGDVPGHRSYTV